MKRFVALFIIIALAACCAACVNDTPAAEGPLDEPTVTDEPEDNGVLQSADDPVDENADGDVGDVAEETLDLGIYTIVVPEEWKDKFSYITGDNGIQFFSLSARSADFDGLLCWIGTYPDMSAEQAKRLDETYYLGEKDGASYIMTYPVNVNFDQLAPEISAEYETMLGCLAEIVASFKMK